MKQVLVIFLLLQCLGSVAQKKEIVFDHLTIKDGLAHNSVLSMVQDRYGYLWIGTQNGLNKYDGVDFSLFKTQNANPNSSLFKGKQIVSLFEDSIGNLWVGTANHGLNIKWNGTDYFENITLDSLINEQSTVEITSINEDHKGHIWICTSGHGVIRYHIETKQTTHLTNANSGLSNDYTFDMKMVLDKVYIATAGKGLNVLEGDTFKQRYTEIPNTPSMDGFRKKLLLDNQTLYVASEGSGLYSIHLKTEDIQHYSSDTKGARLSSHLVRDVIKDQHGSILIATDGGGLNVLDPKTNTVYHYDNSRYIDYSLNSNALLCLLKDKNESIWIGTFNGGVNLIQAKGNRIKYIKAAMDQHSTVDHSSVLALLETEMGLLMGTDGGGLNKLDTKSYPTTFQSYKLATNASMGLYGNVVKTLFNDAQNNLWIGTFGAGLARYNYQEKQLQQFVYDPNYSLGIGGNNIWGIAQRRNHDIWIATMGEGLSVLPYGQTIFSKFKHEASQPNSLIDDRVSCILVDKKDQVWIGTNNSGLDKWDEKINGFIHFQFDPNKPESISSNEITCLFEDSKGFVWIGTGGGGLNKCISEGKFERITEENGLYSNDVLGIIEDNDGFLWLSNYSGITRYNTQSKKSKHFPINKSAYGTQFNPMSITKNEEGVLFFGGINGAYSIDPQDVKNDSVSSNLLFTSFSIFNKEAKQGDVYKGKIALDKPIEEEDHIFLDYTQNSFSIAFASVNPSQDNTQEYEYQLEGFDKDWLPISTNKGKVNYTNLDAGQYSFLVKNSIEQKQISITIAAPFWRKTWFKIAMGWLFLITVVMLYAYSMQITEERHKKQISEAESKILQLENKNLQVELESQNSKLLFSTAQMAHKNEILSAMKKELKSKQKDSGINLSSIVRGLDRELQSEDYWKEFNVYFNQVDGDFVNKIKSKHASLTKNDIRLSALIRIGLSTNEIASILNISIRGVEKGKYRLKKRIGLEATENLLDYIVGFNE